MMMPDTSLWPINLMWGIHDFSMESAQEGENFMKALENNFGKVDMQKTGLHMPNGLVIKDTEQFLKRKARIEWEFFFG
jgi:hypothetical protein